MINFIRVCSVLVALAVVFPWDQVLGEGSGDDSTVLPPECTPEFRNARDHTMCKYFDNELVIRSGVSDEDKKLIVYLHNKYRSEVEPPATDMSKVIWDDKLAAVANKWAKQCELGHDKNRHIPSYGMMPIGQNAAAGQKGWEGAVRVWYNEVRFFKYGEDPKNYLGGKSGWKKIGHYTQVVSNRSYRVGCGFAECSSTKYGRFYICNYGLGQGSVSRPYTAGEDRCSDCPNSCKNGLCDCGGKLCLHSGKLNIDSCTCECLKIYSGSNCETLNCPESDSSRCWKSVMPKHCRVAWVRASCPFMCGLCGGPNGATPPPVFVSKHNCSYQGQRPSPETCSTYGEDGADGRYCETRGGQYGCHACLRYSNVKRDFCPVMCGLCDGPCNGKTCLNGGKLNRVNCQCECPVPYSGETCENTHCPATLKDGRSCWNSLTPPDCAKYSNVPTMCPWMCGLCGSEGATPPPEFTSAYGCTYKGQRPSKADCQNYGNKGADSWACGTNGGQFICDDCIKFSNVKKDYCPVMCGLCDP